MCIFDAVGKSSWQAWMMVCTPDQQLLVPAEDSAPVHSSAPPTQAHDHPAPAPQQQQYSQHAPQQTFAPTASQPIPPPTASYAPPAAYGLSHATSYRHISLSLYHTLLL